MSDHTDLDVVLNLTVELGWSFLPVYGRRRPSQAKRPVLELVRHWPSASTSDARALRSWAKQGYGLALDCGKSGVVVLDADRPADCDGLELGDAWVISGNPQRRSFIFDAPGPIGCATAGWPAGEVKGMGGYVVMPPSFHAVGGAYRWISRQGSRVMPDSIRALLTLREHARPPAGGEPNQAITAGAMCRRLRSVCRRHAVILLTDASVPRQDAMRQGMLEIMRMGMQGHQGSAAALEVLRENYRLSVQGDPQRERMAELEYARLFKRTPAFLAGWDLQPQECRGPLCGTLVHGG